MAPWQWILGGAAALGAAYLGFRLLPGVVEGAQRLGTAAEGGLGSIGGSIVDFFTGGAQQVATDVVTDVVQDTVQDVVDDAADFFNPYQPAYGDAAVDASGQVVDPALSGEALVDELANRLTQSQARGDQNYIEATARYVRQQRIAAAQPSIDEQIQIQRESAAAVREAALAAQREYLGQPTTDFDYYDPDGEAVDVLDDPAEEATDTTPIYDFDAAREQAFSTRSVPKPIFGGLGGDGHTGGRPPAGVPTAPVVIPESVANLRERIQGILSQTARNLQSGSGPAGDVEGPQLPGQGSRPFSTDVTVEGTPYRIYTSRSPPLSEFTVPQLQARLDFYNSPAGRGLLGTGGIRDRAIETVENQLRIRRGEY